jgi:hypothetical protein
MRTYCRRGTSASSSGSRCLRDERQRVEVGPRRSACTRRSTVR